MLLLFILLKIFIILYHKILKTVTLVIIMMAMREIQFLLTIAILQVMDQTIAWKVSVFGVILVRIFSHWDWIRTRITLKSKWLNFDISSFNISLQHQISLSQHQINLSNWISLSLRRISLSLYEIDLSQHHISLLQHLSMELFYHSITATN